MHILHYFTMILRFLHTNTPCNLALSIVDRGMAMFALRTAVAHAVPPRMRLGHSHGATFSSSTWEQVELEGRQVRHWSRHFSGKCIFMAPASFLDHHQTSTQSYRAFAQKKNHYFWNTKLQWMFCTCCLVMILYGFCWIEDPWFAMLIASGSFT